MYTPRYKGVSQNSVENFFAVSNWGHYELLLSSVEDYLFSNGQDTHIFFSSRKLH